MFVTNFWVKYSVTKVVLTGFQVFDIGRKNPERVRRFRALERTVDYIEANMPSAISVETQKELIDFSLEETRVEGHYLEFGIYKGGTMRYMARRRPGVAFHGFDSFEGLPEHWSGHSLTKHSFTREGRLPSVPGNVVLHKGWFSETLPKWCAEHSGNAAFIHIDCDIYSSTVEILKNLTSRMQPGTVILFDEYFNYPNWENHEFKAWQEFVAEHRVAYEYIGFAREQVAVRITGVGA